MAQLTYETGDYLKSRAYLQRYSDVTKHTAASLWLGLQLERKLGDRNAEASYALLLRSEFPDSEEAHRLSQSGQQ